MSLSVLIVDALINSRGGSLSVSSSIDILGYRSHSRNYEQSQGWKASLANDILRAERNWNRRNLISRRSLKKCRSGLWFNYIHSFNYKRYLMKVFFSPLPSTTCTHDKDETHASARVARRRITCICTNTITTCVLDSGTCTQRKTHGYTRKIWLCASAAVTTFIYLRQTWNSWCTRIHRGIARPKGSLSWQFPRGRV